ncbi:hypothetical protein [Streptomyces sp. NPDC051577]
MNWKPGAAMPEGGTQASLAFVGLTAGELTGMTIAMKTAGRFGRRLPQAC